MLLVVPRTRDGLTRLTADLPIAPLSDVLDSLKDEDMQVSIPSFSVETTTKPVAALAKVCDLVLYQRFSVIRPLLDTRQYEDSRKTMSVRIYYYYLCLLS